MILRLALVFLAGIAGHQSYEPTKIFGARWGSLLRYAIGLLLFIPSSIVVKSGLPEAREHFGEVERDLVTGLLTAGALGTGTMVGHFLDRHGEDDK